MATAGFRQEMPPKGGFGGITWDRIPLKKPWSGAKIFSLWATVTLFSWYNYGLQIQRRRRLERENDELVVALEPLLCAERDRMYLNQLRKNREEEADLMKNIPGWKVGTLFGESCFKTNGDKLVPSTVLEYYAHSAPREFFYNQTYGAWI